MIFFDKHNILPVVPGSAASISGIYMDSKNQRLNLEANITESKKGTSLCDPDGYLYSRNYVNNDKIVWLCKKYYTGNLKCKARATTQGPVIISLRGTHNHEADNFNPIYE